MLRNEYKYLLPLSKLDALRRAVMPFVDMDRYAANRAEHQYTVRSIYFDRPDLPFYHEKIEGIERRKKIRIRGYNQLNHPSRVYLEIKRKYNVLTEKQRAPVYFHNLARLLDSKDIHKYVLDRPGIDGALENAQRFFYNVTALYPRPVVLVVYHREAFYSKFNRQLRLTIDKHIHRRLTPGLDLFSDHQLEPVLQGYFVFEIKFYRGLPYWLSALIREFNLRRQPVSKYTTSLEIDSLVPFDELNMIKTML
ncbi:polyphosphate polymerase domain-containing protein [candidate division KSB1 bacterium]|nr:polyphosphate polymerase domain-containing protein [candidate division KSB1 bacterium]